MLIISSEEGDAAVIESKDAAVIESEDADNRA
jgi:hypothetical protein